MTRTRPHRADSSASAPRASRSPRGSVPTAAGSSTDGGCVGRRTRRPWVSAKAAVSLDGRIATRTGHSKWITGKAARNRGLELREEHDAILVGVGTVLADDPRLTRRLGLNPGDDWRRVDPRLEAADPDRRRRRRSPSPRRPSSPTPPRPPMTTARASTPPGSNSWSFPPTSDGRVDIGALLDHLGDRGITALLVEGGATVHGSFFDADLVDEVFFFVAPIIIGGEAPAAVGGLGVADSRDGASLSLRRCPPPRRRPRTPLRAAGGCGCSRV